MSADMKCKPLTESDWIKIFRLRCRSKKGEELTPEERKLCRRAWKENPERYMIEDKAVFEATKPFGA